ncbi:MAG TPA: DUF1329 domain-containing protein, partial [Myxococcota bacterium]|nr:DUF1329 domain-containing protein [Myxococcota bacterium]
MRAAPFAAAQTAAMLALLGALLAQPVARAATGLPEPGACPTTAGRADAAALLDATAALVHEGGALEYRDLPRVSALLPAEVWGQRRIFFSAGMRMEIGACHRRYPAPRSFEEASARFAGAARLDAAGNLLDYRAGLPFPPEAIARDDPAAAAKWAWNLEYRHRGA